MIADRAQDGRLDAATIQATFRRLTPDRHPILDRISRDAVYDHGRWMAPGGLVLADAMASRLALAPGQRVLDLGCGRGQSSIFLASHYGVSVVSVDLWITSEERRRAATAAGSDHRITPLQGDIRRGLPAAHAGFDAIFCLQAFHTFGTAPAMLRYLATLLRPGGRLCLAQGCLSDEVAVLPAAFDDTGGWRAEYQRYHSPGWWQTHLVSSGLFDVEVCEELHDGCVFWEDDVLYRGDRAGWSHDFLSQNGWLIRHIQHGRTHRPRLTHLLLAASRRLPKPADAAARDTA